jgi:hypothetical protein
LPFESWNYRCVPPHLLDLFKNKSPWCSVSGPVLRQVWTHFSLPMDSQGNCCDSARLRLLAWLTFLYFQKNYILWKFKNVTSEKRRVIYF